MINFKYRSTTLIPILFYVAYCLLFTFLLVSRVEAQPRVSERVLIQDVILIDPERLVEDVTVNILIVDEKLDLVTKDKVPAGDGTKVYNAQGGFLIGKLHLGEPASFIILDGDPRIDIQILLDTTTHIVFGIRKGEIVRNRLISVEKSSGEAVKTGWFAYTPPPLTLPLSYAASTSWNKWKTKWVNGAFLAVLGLDRQRWFSQDDNSEQQVGDLSDYEAGEIRDIRFGVVGTLNFPKPWVYTFFVANDTFDKGFDTDSQKDYSIFDYRLDIPLYDSISIALGKQKEPMTMERVNSLIYIPWQERSAPNNSFMVGRNVGVVLSGMYLNRRATWAGGVFNDWIEDDESFDENSTQYVGRLTWLPYLSEKEDTLLHLGVGMRYNNAKEGIQYRSKPEFHQAPVFVDTGVLEADAAQSYSAEIAFRSGPFWLEGEYIYNTIDAPDLEDPVFDGYRLGASWTLTGEMRPYNHKSGVLGRIPVAKTVYQGGIGTWEAALRWSSVDLTDGLVEGGEMDIFSVGLNWWLSSFFFVSANYRYITLDNQGVIGTSDGVNLRIGLLLE